MLTIPDRLYSSALFNKRAKKERSSKTAVSFASFHSPLAVRSQPQTARQRHKSRTQILFPPLISTNRSSPSLLRRRTREKNKKKESRSNRNTKREKRNTKCFLRRRDALQSAAEIKKNEGAGAAAFVNQELEYHIDKVTPAIEEAPSSSPTQTATTNATAFPITVEST